MRCVKSWVPALLALAPAIAAADPSPELELSAAKSRIGWGTTLGPDRVALATDGGWNGAEARAEMHAIVEARVIDRASVFVTTSYEARARPGVGAAYQLLDPRSRALGLRASFQYKPEGFTEPEGELEGQLVAMRPLGGGAGRLLLAYGQDPEGNEADAELGASYVHHIAGAFVAGASARYRYGIAVKNGEPSWDLLGGAIAGFAPGAWRVELFLGGTALDRMGTKSGAVAMLGASADL